MTKVVKRKRLKESHLVVSIAMKMVLHSLHFDSIHVPIKHWTLTCEN